MNMVIILLVNGFFLTVLLIVFLIVLSRQNGNHLEEHDIKEDLKKIKEQINHSE